MYGLTFSFNGALVLYCTIVLALACDRKILNLDTRLRDLVLSEGFSRQEQAEPVTLKSLLFFRSDIQSM